MEMNEVVLKQRLMDENPEFARLVQRHQQYDHELQNLVNQPYLSPEEQMKETQLKKMKLRLKDEMARIMWSEQQEQQNW
ncbi:YdcH family protein [bacterium]|nr:YdcH family protein [bacterium]